MGIFFFGYSVAQTLQTVTTNGNVTSNYIFITGQGNPPSSGTGIGISYLPSLNLSAIESRSWSNGIYQPMVINGSTVGLSSRVLINGVGDDGVAALQINGPIDDNTGLNNGQDRPAVSAGTIQGEIRGISSGWYNGDDGFLRLSAGGGSNVSTKSYIDLSGYTYPTTLDRYENIAFGTSGIERMRILYNGNIGIGTTNPNRPLVLEVPPIAANTTNGILNFSDGRSADFQIDLSVGNNTGVAYGLTTLKTTSYNLALAVNNGASYVERMRITSNGNIGIGTSNPQSLLSVNGIITGKQVTVTQTGWSDFVFNKGYKLRPLSGVADYIARNNHLPDIPSAKEVETKGLNLGDMQQKQMQKIEELVLYQIDADKKMNLLKDQNEQLKRELNKYQSELQDLKNEVAKLKNNK